MPITINVIYYLLKDFQNDFIRHLNLTIALGIILDGEMVLNVELIIEFLNILIFERLPIIYDDGNGDTLPIYNAIKDKHGKMLVDDLCKGNNLNPLCEVFNGSDDEFVGEWILPTR